MNVDTCSVICQIHYLWHRNKLKIDCINYFNHLIRIQPANTEVLLGVNSQANQGTKALASIGTT